MSIQTIEGTVGTTIANLAYQKSPIILTDGLATAIGGFLPMFLLTEGLALGANAITSALRGSFKIPSLQDMWVDWIAQNGTQLMRNEVATYPFANQTVAANAMIVEPLYIGMRMIAPTNEKVGYLGKLALMQEIIATLERHVEMGGSFIVITPYQVYRGCLLRGVSDASPKPSTRQGEQYDFQFERPLTSSSEATQRMGTLMKRLSGGMKGVGGWGGYGGILGSILS